MRRIILIIGLHKETRTLDASVFLSFLLLLGIIQAFFVNILHIPLYILTGYIYLLLFFYLKNIFFDQFQFIILYLLIFYELLIIIIDFLLIDSSFLKEFIYHINSLVYILVPMLVMYETRYIIVFSKKLLYITGIYFILSLMIHLFAWETLAQIFYTKNSWFGGLYLSGEIKRMYGLFWNPLISAYTFLLLIFVGVLLSYKSRAFYIISGLIIMFSFVRTAYVSLGIFFILFLLFKQRILLFLGLVVVGLWLIVLIEPLQSVVMGIIHFQDSTGSAQEHLSNYIIGLNSMGDIFGVGFQSAESAGGWNVRLESWIFQFAYVHGLIGSLPLILIAITGMIIMLKDKNIIGLVSMLAFLPVLISFPVYTFNITLIIFTVMFAFALNKSKYVQLIER